MSNNEKPNNQSDKESDQPAPPPPPPPPSPAEGPSEPTSNKDKTTNGQDGQINVKELTPSDFSFPEDYFK
ncbi:unnamed protein product [Clonostachys chloroleuca]|nr:unnamed protein product [Clonostachys chloroleuca]CAI6089232.1 unnamed protein product [Clonostachys chloroleuca]CAI6097796.1 unnamed protein product [Clonostachys chloroleuca]